MGAPADFVIWRCEDPATVPYRYGAPLVDDVYFAGVPRVRAERRSTDRDADASAGGRTVCTRDGPRTSTLQARSR